MVGAFFLIVKTDGLYAVVITIHLPSPIAPVDEAAEVRG